MTNAKKRDRIRQSLLEHPEWSDRQHARTLLCSAQTVASVRAQTRTEPEHPKLVRAQGGRLVAVVDLIVERGDAELYFAAGFELPPELTDLPRRAAA